MADPILLYSELAEWWPLLSAPSDYAEGAAYYDAVLREQCVVTPRTLLELGSGGGNNASHLKHRFEHLTLVDLSSDMLAVSRELNPECEHVLGDMRSVRLGRQFDCVFVHDAVGYATSLDELSRVFETAYTHCRPGGVALFVPDHVRENFGPRTAHGGHDGEGRSLRYLEWTWDPDESDTTFFVDMAYFLRDQDGSVQVRHDRHVEGLFSMAQWVAGLEDAGFSARVRRHRYSDVPFESVCFVGRRPAGRDG
jgi:SAM-dependent methyltransferase